MRQENNCWSCGGSGKQLCDRCKGSGLVPQLDLSFISVIGVSVLKMIPCPDCEGKGYKKCRYCHGTGKKEKTIVK